MTTTSIHPASITFLVKKKIIIKLDLTNKIGANIKKREMQTITTIPTIEISTMVY